MKLSNQLCAFATLRELSISMVFIKGRYENTRRVRCERGVTFSFA